MGEIDELLALNDLERVGEREVVRGVDGEGDGDCGQAQMSISSGEDLPQASSPPSTGSNTPSI